jgi:hypothetical protein
MGVRECSYAAGMTRVFASRYSADLQPGDGGKIAWDVGETVEVISGQDAGRRFVITSDYRTHGSAPAGEYVREGYFEDDTARTPWAKLEKALWFCPQSSSSPTAPTPSGRLA